MGFSEWIPRFPNVKAEVHQKILSVCISMSPYSPSHTFFLDTIKGIYNKDASLFIHLKKVVSIHLPCIIQSKLHEFQDDYWKYCTSMVDELGLRMHAITI